MPGHLSVKTPRFLFLCLDAPSKQEGHFRPFLVAINLSYLRSERLAPKLMWNTCPSNASAGTEFYTEFFGLGDTVLLTAKMHYFNVEPAIVQSTED